MALGYQLLICAGTKHRQSRLQRDRDRIDQQLKTTANLIEQAQKNRNNASQQVSLLDNQIQLRERKVNHHYATIRSLERTLEGKNQNSEFWKDTSPP